MNFNNNNRQFGLWKSVNYVLVQFVNHVGIDTYLVRTEFNENADSTVYDTVERITSKDI